MICNRFGLGSVMLAVLLSGCRTTNDSGVSTVVVRPIDDPAEANRLAGELLSQARAQNVEVAKALDEITSSVLMLPNSKVSNEGYSKRCFMQEEFGEPGVTVYTYRFNVESSSSEHRARKVTVTTSDTYIVQVPTDPTPSGDLADAQPGTVKSYEVIVPTDKPTKPAAVGPGYHTLKILFETDPIDMESKTILPFKVLKVRRTLGSTPC